MPRERLRCQNCLSSLTIHDRADGEESDEFEVLKFKLWRKTHGSHCFKTGDIGVHEEVTL